MYITEGKATSSPTEELETTAPLILTIIATTFSCRDMFPAHSVTNFMIIEIYAIDIKKIEPCEMKI